MIYTIGKKELYERYFLEQDAPKKLGREDGYPGGSVWETFEKAEAFCPQGYGVYGL